MVRFSAAGNGLPEIEATPSTGRDEDEAQVDGLRFAAVCSPSPAIRYICLHVRHGLIRISSSCQTRIFDVVGVINCCVQNFSVVYNITERMMMCRNQGEKKISDVDYMAHGRDEEGSMKFALVRILKQT